MEVQFVDTQGFKSVAAQIDPSLMHTIYGFMEPAAGANEASMDVIVSDTETMQVKLKCHINMHIVGWNACRLTDS